MQQTLPPNRYEDIEMHKVYTAIWGESIQFGRYEKGNETVDEAVLKTKNRMAAMLDKARVKSVLEVGSGNGATARYLAKKEGWFVTATNYTDRQNLEALEATRQAGLGGRIAHAWADFHALPFGDESFDAHWSQECLVHAADKPRYFSEAYRVLRPGGQIIFTEQTTDRSKLDEDTERLLCERHSCTDLWSADEFAESCTDAGFELEVLEDWSEFMPTHFGRVWRKIQDEWARLSTTIDPWALRFNREMWRLGEKISADGVIGWMALVARKPE